MKRIISKLFGSLVGIIQYTCIAHCTFRYLVDFVMCRGSSMEPTIFSNEVLLTHHFTPHFRKLQRGDVVIARCPTNPQQFICKRIIGLPGDAIKVGFKSTEIVPIGHVWIEGDNRSNSSDSRSYGPVPLGLIQSRALCKVWPFEEISSLTS